MSPEQVRGTKLDPRSDLYSIGISLYELVSGIRPFRDQNDYDLMLAQIQQSPPPPNQVVPNLPQALNEIILKALEKDTAKRFQTADTFRAALKNVMIDQRTAVLDSPKPFAPTTSRRGLFAVVAAILAIPLIVVLAIKIYNFLKDRGAGHPATSVGGSSPAPTRPRPRFLALSGGDMVFVEAGEALLGQGRQSVHVEGFYIDRTEVTNQAYLMICRETGHPKPPGAEQAPSDYPVVNVTFDDAKTFATWAKKRLPTAWEWEKAARGTRGLTYPWGDNFCDGLANIPPDKRAAKSATLAPVTVYPLGASPHGVPQSLGNGAGRLGRRDSGRVSGEFGPKRLSLALI
jgi:formylglycine-generating enzyme required for sulfatase activity